MAKKLFIVGTGTDVGKTFVTGLILKKLHMNGMSAAYYKAAMSGNERDADGSLIPGDALSVKTVSGIRQPAEEMCPYVYEAAVSPHLAARLEGTPVEMERVMSGLDAVCEKYDFVTIEGSGGIVCPLRKDDAEIWLEDVIRASAGGGGAPCLLVADAGLGTINSVRLTAFYMMERHIPLKGIIFNRFIPGNEMHEDNLMMCERLTGLRVLAKVRVGDTELNMQIGRLTNLYE